MGTKSAKDSNYCFETWKRFFILTFSFLIFVESHRQIFWLINKPRFLEKRMEKYTGMLILEIIVSHKMFIKKLHVCFLSSIDSLRRKKPTNMDL